MARFAPSPALAAGGRRAARRGGRRTKIIRRFPGETSALSLIWAVLELSSRGWRGITMTPNAVAEIERLRRGHTPRTDHARSVTDKDVVAA